MGLFFWIGLAVAGMFGALDFMDTLNVVPIMLFLILMWLMYGEKKPVKKSIEDNF
ncbi:MAG TPA: hypothetical protein VMR37_03675 [Rhabdochlamydiaceae bacterium]|jgi:hypothetical protein|nr:hypothetical protein [Rhabdochlamydiaceae bacterium]